MQHANAMKINAPGDIKFLEDLDAMLGRPVSGRPDSSTKLSLEAGAGDIAGGGSLLTAGDAEAQADRDRQRQREERRPRVAVDSPSSMKRYWARYLIEAVKLNAFEPAE